MATVHNSAEYRITTDALTPAGYPTEFVPDSYSFFPEADFESRRADLLAHISRNPAPSNTKPAYFELARLAHGSTPHPGILRAALAYIDGRNDCADFVIHAFLRLLYQFEGQTALDDEVRDTILNFKYWPDEPGVDSLCTWTENHTILYASAAYLAGQRFPDAVFTNSGQTGREKMALNRPRILRWLDLRFHTGFSEWLSHVYYDEDFTALLSLIDFCADNEIQQRATMVLDLLLLDMALNSFHGVFGSTHGRAYENTKKWASNEGTTDTAKLLFGMGQYSGFDNMSAVAFALSSYRVSPIIIAIAQDLARPAMENRQRMGIRVDDGARWGLDYDNFEDGMMWLTLEAYMHPRTAALTLRMFDAFNWWDNHFFAAFKPYRSLLNILRKTHLVKPLARALAWDLCRNTREQVNITTYRTPDYMLSCAQDYRPGYGGDQQHIWQATLGPDAVCFTTHPAKLEGVSPNYWEGSGQLPRAAQVKNVVFVVYNLHRKPALYVPTRHFFTHAWLPCEQFDVVIECDGWIFARKGDGYLALYSQQPYRWHTDAASEKTHNEIIADGKHNIWICELGRRADDGDFETFMTRITGARLEFSGSNVIYESPTQGKLKFGWQGALRQNGREVRLARYGRYENPYVRADFSAETITIRHDNHTLTLDWQNGHREID